jgi:hypothetical protein
MRRFWVVGQETRLPINPASQGRHGIALVPRDIIRDLPLAADMSDVSRVAFENSIIRDRVNALIADFAKATIKDKKRALKAAALQSAETFLDLFDALLNSDTPYEAQADPDGIYVFREALTRVAKEYPLTITKPRSKTQPELIRVVKTIIDHFRILVENKDISSLLRNKSNPRNERAAQLLFYAVSEAYCKANKVEISPETNMGGGPVDFKF